MEVDKGRGFKGTQMMKIQRGKWSEGRKEGQKKGRLINRVQ